MFIRNMLSRKWILATVLAAGGVYVMINLGFWQLDRLEQRRSLNARLIDQMEARPLELTTSSINENLYEMEFRQVVVKGEYDFSQQVALRNQYIDGSIGVHLLTPLVIEGTGQAILIDRGWIPLEDEAPKNWSQYDEPGTVIVAGVIRRSQLEPQLNMLPDPTLAPGQTRLDTWTMVHLDRIAEQVSWPLVDVYVQQSPDEAWTGLPLRNPTEIEITEGPHMNYALQWFAFALLLGIGYPYYVRKTMLDEARMEKEIDKNNE